jgi:hypothetical protein
MAADLTIRAADNAPLLSLSSGTLLPSSRAGRKDDQEGHD